MVICPILYGAAIVAQAIMQSTKMHAFEGVGSGETSGGLLSETQCKRENCQWWGAWSWGEEEEGYEFRLVTASGCTFGQINCVQRDGTRG